MWLFFRGPPTARWRGPRLARSSARNPRSATSVSRQTLLLDDETPVSAVASVTSPGVVDFVVESLQESTQIRRATAVLHAGGDEDQPPAYDMPALLAAHSCRLDGAELRKQFDEHGLQYGPAFAGLAAVHSADETVGTVLAEVGLPGPIRSQQSAYGVHPALLDACFQSVAAHSDGPGRR